MAEYQSNHTGIDIDSAVSLALNPAFSVQPSTSMEGRKLITSGAVYDYIDKLPAKYIYMHRLTINGWLNCEVWTTYPHSFTADSVTSITLDEALKSVTSESGGCHIIYRIVGDFEVPDVNGQGTTYYEIAHTFYTRRGNCWQVLAIMDGVGLVRYPLNVSELSGKITADSVTQYQVGVAL